MHSETNVTSALYNLVEVRGLFLRERAGSFYSLVCPRKVQALD